ncbi:beta-1,3-galactosyltransferase brn-like [Saccostrea echinata]|uniref:beta-1,3-galactosyltransferase brn-like n=1 Tax=Saccostrea echinata TaxID=191078 RepID=UPI002A81D108|nr:beta-1,3-galactosyltransferase brn-like [Saccostrea echinata]
MKKFRCTRILLGNSLRNFLIMLALCLSVLNMMNWIYYNYSEALVETYNKYSPSSSMVQIARSQFTLSTSKVVAANKKKSPVVNQKIKRRYPIFDPSASYAENGVHMEVGPPLDTKDIRKKKLNFDPKKYPLEIDLVQLTKNIFEGKKIKNNQINPHPYQFVHEAENACQIENLHVVVLVKSKASNFKSREIIRQTWGNQSLYNGVSVVFLLGKMKEFENDIAHEAQKYKDIVQENFVDQYSNNTLKTIMGYNWVVRHCSNANFNLFVDDDVFVVVKNLDNYRQTKEKEPRLMAGKLLPHSTPFRDNGSKWFVSWEDYPFDKYPPYLAGGGILMSWDVTRAFAAAFPYVKTISIDDSYLGIIAKKLNISPRNHGGMVIRNPGRDTKAAMSMNFATVVAFHRIPSPESMMATWNQYIAKYPIHSKPKR